MIERIKVNSGGRKWHGRSEQPINIVHYPLSSFITVVLVTSLSVLEFPRNRAISISMNTAPPITQTHGEVYHSVRVEVVVVVVTLLALSWAKSTTCQKLNKETNRNLWPERKLIFFILNSFS